MTIRKKNYIVNNLTENGLCNFIIIKMGRQYVDLRNI